VSFHGSKDAAVPIEQLDLIIKDCVEHRKAFEAHYYPDETHLFTHRATWRDALQKIAAAIARHLGPGQQPRAADWPPGPAGDRGGGLD